MAKTEIYEDAMEADLEAITAQQQSRMAAAACLGTDQEFRALLLDGLCLFASGTVLLGQSKAAGEDQVGTVLQLLTAEATRRARAAVEEVIGQASVGESS